MKESLSHFYDELHAYARQRVGCAETAGDLVQDAFARVLARGIRLEQPRAYLYRVLINLIHDRGRCAARLPQILAEAHLFENEPPAEEMTPLEVLASREASTRLRKAIEGLPVRCREVFVLHRFEGLRQREIAARLGITQSTVEKHIAAALVHLRRELADLFE